LRHTGTVRVVKRVLAISAALLAVGVGTGVWLYQGSPSASRHASPTHTSEPTQATATGGRADNLTLVQALTRRTLPTALSGVVVIEGGPPPVFGSPPVGARPYPHVPVLVTGTTAAGVHVVRRLVADGHGRFALKLRPGKYIVAANWARHAPLAVKPQTTVTIMPGLPVRTRVVTHTY
jgi:hypothetical protein